MSEKQTPVVTGADALDKVTNSLVVKALQEDLGISADELQASVAHIQRNKRETGSWEQATREFLAAHPDWPGGQNMQDLISTKLEELGLTDQPSAKSIQRAYDALCAEVEQDNAINNAKSPRELEEILGKTARMEARIRRGNIY